MRIAAEKGRGEGARLAALLALAALLFQSLIPAATMAAPRPDSSPLVICTASGVEIVSSKAPSSHPNGFAGLPCQDCLFAALAVIAPPELTVRPVIYEPATIEWTRPSRPVPPRARAPPRPPGQGPPALHV